MKELQSILETLDSFQKVELEDIRHFFGAEVSSRTRKKDLVCKLKAYIVDEPALWLDRMLERDLRLLKLLVQAGPEVPVRLEYADYPSVLETIHLLGTDNSDDRYRYVWIPKELYDVVATKVDSAILRGEESGRFEMDQASLGYLSLYGVMTTDTYYDCMAEYWEYSHRGSFDSFIDTLYNSPVLKIGRMDIEGVPYVVAPQVVSAEDVLNARESDPEMGLKPFTVPQALEAGARAPHFVYGADSPEGKEVLNVLSSLNCFGEEAMLEMHDIWMNSQMVGKEDSTEEIFKFVNDRQDLIPSFSEYDACMRAIAAYANSLPKWILGGHSSDEVKRMAIVLQGDSDDPLEELVAKNPLLGLFVPPSPADAPCPCGSGLSYRFCHGRYKN